MLGRQPSPEWDTCPKLSSMKSMTSELCVVQDFGCSRDDFNCQCPPIVNASSNGPAVPAAVQACIANPAAAPAPAAAPSLAAASAPVLAAAAPESGAAIAPVPASGKDLPIPWQVILMVCAHAELSLSLAFPLLGTSKNHLQSCHPYMIPLHPYVWTRACLLSGVPLPHVYTPLYRQNGLHCQTQRMHVCSTIRRPPCGPCFSKFVASDAVCHLEQQPA